MREHDIEVVEVVRETFDVGARAAGLAVAARVVRRHVEASRHECGGELGVPPAVLVHAVDEEDRARRAEVGRPAPHEEGGAVGGGERVRRVMH